ncbi:MAG: M23 family metallopeptidase [Pseudomonadota bacterium]|nr:M23 family metallopeptidase [Pseudomonadota bacterium]
MKTSLSLGIQRIVATAMALIVVDAASGENKAMAQGALVITIGRQANSAFAGRMQSRDDPTGSNAAVITVGRAIDMAASPLRFSRTIFSAPPPATVIAAVPGMAMPRMMAASRLSSPRLSSPRLSSMPISGILTSGFGMREHPLLGVWRPHLGVDLAAPVGTPIAATSDGIVTRSGWTGGYGLAVELDNGGGMQTRFGHMSRLNVVPGEQVHTGEVIGFVGSTGLSTGPHLHYEVRVNGRAINPLAN